MKQKLCKKNMFEYMMLALFACYILLYYLFGAKSNTVIYSEVVLVAFLGLAAISIFKSGKIKCNIPIIVTVIFAAYCFITSFWAINSALAIDRAKTMFILSIFLFVAYNFLLE